MSFGFEEVAQIDVIERLREVARKDENRSVQEAAARISDRIERLRQDVDAGR